MLTVAVLIQRGVKGKKSCHEAEEWRKLVAEGLQPSSASIDANSKGLPWLWGGHTQAPHIGFYHHPSPDASGHAPQEKPPLPPPLPCCETALRIIALKIFT